MTEKQTQTQTQETTKQEKRAKKIRNMSQEVEVSMYGEERSGLLAKVSELHHQAMDRLKTYLGLEQEKMNPTHDQMIHNLRKYAVKMPTAFWDEVEKQLKEFGAVGISDLYCMSPENNRILDKQKHDADKLTRLTMTKQLELSILTNQAVYWINQNQLQDDVLGECMRELEAWCFNGEIAPKEA